MNSFEKKTNKTEIKKVKNPCKICSKNVDTKTGLQCKGACKKWAHYKCLNYNHEHIASIKCGLIKINCPCPDCENDHKVYQSNWQGTKSELNQRKTATEISLKWDKCNKTFCPGVPNESSHHNAFNNRYPLNPKPIPYGVSEGTSYEYNVENQSNQYVTDEQNEEEQEENEEQEDEEEECFDAQKRQRKHQIVLLAKSSSQLTAAVCCDSSRSLTGYANPVATKQTGQCCTSGPCNSSSSASSSDNNAVKKKDGKKVKKVKEKKVREKKVKDKKPKKVIEKKVKEKKVKEKKIKKNKKKKKGKGNKGETSKCCCSRCCNPGIVKSTSKMSLCSNKSDDSCKSETSTASAKSAKSTISTRSTQAPCGEMIKECPYVHSPIKLMNKESCCTDAGDSKGKGYRGRIQTPYYQNMNKCAPNQVPPPIAHRYNPPAQYDSRRERYGMPSRVGRPGLQYDGHPSCPPHHIPQSNPNCPPIPRGILQQHQNMPPQQYPTSYGPQLLNCPPGNNSQMKPISKCPSNCPGPVGGRLYLSSQNQTKLVGKCGAILPGSYDPNIFPNTNSTHLLCLSTPNKSKSCCTLNKTDQKEGTNTTSDISVHMAYCSKSDMSLKQQYIEEYNRKMLLLTLERMCQTMGQFSMQFRELMSKMADTLDGKDEK